MCVGPLIVDSDKRREVLVFSLFFQCVGCVFFQREKKISFLCVCIGFTMCVYVFCVSFGVFVYKSLGVCV